MSESQNSMPLLSPEHQATMVAAYQALKVKNDLMRDYDTGINAKLQSALGLQWHFASEEQIQQILSPRQQDWRMLRYFYEALSNDGDLFRRVSMIYNQPEAFRAIGAFKTLEAAEALREHHIQLLSFGTLDEQETFWAQTREQRKPIEQQADSVLELADLLIRFAETHPDEFIAVPAADPFDQMFERLAALKQHIIDTGATPS
ncbi:hypothetical protein [Verrucomicrobium sp. BvORR106]|uniref:hypothetical protein n=1 Tax=Verrucomicrobium sp. BvORR106 TaxID=1403819 RepID=UPI00056E1FE9|nr:hypothetical protein [Verrucomicrobium sp. BvORR106]